MKKYIVLFALLIGFTAQAQVFNPLKFQPRFNASLATQSKALTGPSQTLKNSQVDTTQTVNYVYTPGDTLLELGIYTENGDSIHGTYYAQFLINGKLMGSTAADSFNYHKPSNALVGVVPAKGFSLWHRRYPGANQIRLIVNIVGAQSGWLATPTKTYRVGLVTRNKLDL